MDKTTVLLISLALYVVANSNSFLLMHYDKKAAQKGGRRMPEKRLFLAAACFGGLGGVLGMQILRHKTKHWRFRVFFPCMMAVQIILLGIGCYFLYR